MTIPIYRKISPRATSMIRLDHTHVMTTFHRYQRGISLSRKSGLVGVICTALEIHATLVEEIFYPALRALSENEVIRKSVPEHDEMRRLIGLLRGMSAQDPAYDDTLLELMRNVIHHVADEETVLLPEAERMMTEERLRELGSRMARRRLELLVPASPQIARDMARGMPLAAAMVGAGAGLMVLLACIRPSRNY